MGAKIPESVLVVVYTDDLLVLLLNRADQPGFWQSVTGSKDRVGEPLVETCRREVFEETGVDVRAAGMKLENWHMSQRYEIFPHWRHRYPAGVTHNLEHVFGLRVPGVVPVRLSPREHLEYCWLPWQAAVEGCASPSNQAAIRALPRRVPQGTPF
jgi:dATP pyrophosphohydrolase